jgi:hypothetical protein
MRLSYLIAPRGIEVMQSHTPKGRKSRNGGSSESLLTLLFAIWHFYKCFLALLFQASTGRRFLPVEAYLQKVNLKQQDCQLNSCVELYSCFSENIPILRLS